MIRYMIANFALLTAFLFLFNLVFQNYIKNNSNKIIFRILIGITHGLCGLLLLLFSFRLDETTVMDFRQIIVLSSAFYGGLPASLITALFIAFGRYLLFDGFNSIMLLAFVSITLSGIGSGLIMHYTKVYWRKWLYALLFIFVMISTLSYFTRGFSVITATYLSLLCAGGIFTAALISYFNSTNRLARELAQSENRYRSLHGLQEAIFQSATHTAITVLDCSGKITNVNKAAEKMLGYSQHELIGNTPLLYHDRQEIQVFEQQLSQKKGKTIRGAEVFNCGALDSGSEGQEWTYLRKDGIRLTVLLTLSPLMIDGITVGVIGTATDISARKKMEERLKHLSLIDGLTGIANRRFFDETLLQEWSNAAQHPSQNGLSLLLFDIDNFKAYNDVYGHQAGDDCLRKVTAIARKMLNNPAATIARYGGEEFAVILPDMDSQQALVLAEKIRRAIEKAGIHHQGSTVSRFVTISIGVSTYAPITDPQDQKSPDWLIAKADEALYRSKTQGRNRVTNWSALAAPASVPE
ncbi:sensor domain-containing diguanylate cyclase [Paenibacillus sp. CAU 1782]